MERRPADDAQAREIANPLAKDNREGREADAYSDRRSLTGRYLPRLVVSAAALVPHRYNSHVTYQTRRVATQTQPRPARPTGSPITYDVGDLSDAVLCR